MTAKKTEGMYPQADPTAPGGMSKANLRLELKERHGVSMEESREMSWPDLIEAVAQGRLAREAEVKGEAAHEEQDTNVNDFDPSYMFDALDDADEEDDFADLDDLAEFEAYEAPATQYHADGSEHDQTECLHSEHGGLFADEDEYPGDPGFYVGDEPEPENFDEDDITFDPETLYAEIVEAQAAAQAENPPLFLGIPGIKDYVFDGHAGAGPSASERWMHCTMSLSASKTFLETLTPNQQRAFAGSNTAARQGTTAHSVGEAKANHMLGRIDDDELVSTLLELTVEPDDEAEAYDDEMDDYVNEYVDLIKIYADERGGENIRIESRVEAAIPLDGMHEGETYIIRGSADMTALPTEEHPVLVVGDLKYGTGIWVDAVDNSQAKIYALGVLSELVDEDGNLTVDIETIRLHIIQPRLDGIKTSEITLDDLLDWRDDVLSPDLTKALYGAAEGATYEPSPGACQFCPARGGCPALTEQRVAAAADLFDTVVEAEFEDGPGAFPETTTLSNDRLGALLAQVSGLIDIRKDLKAEAERRLHRGEEVPGYDLVNYTPPRKWKDEDPHPKLVKAVGGKVAQSLYKKPTLVTPAQAENLLGDGYAKIEALIEKPDKRPVISTGPTDRRKKWTGRPPESMFPDDESDDGASASTLNAEEMFPDD